VGHLLDALKRFDSLDPRRVMEITFEVARLGEISPRATKTRRKLLGWNADVLVGISNSQRWDFGNSAKPTASKCGANSCSRLIKRHASGN